MIFDIILFCIVIGFILVTIITLGLYKYNESGFQDRDEKIKQIAYHLGTKLTYETLKKRCPECTNVDYYKVKKLV